MLNMLNGLPVSLILIVLGVLAVLVIFYVIGLQRGLVNFDELCNNALSQIGVQLNSRWDGLIALSDTMKGYAAHEHETLKEVIAQRVRFGKGTSADEVNRQENLLSGFMGKLMAVSEAYPDLKADALYKTTMDNIVKSEDKVRMSRMVYNDSVTKINRKIRMFPAVLFAGMLGFYTRTYLEEPEGKTEMPSFR